jgi:predicted N-formylglutamate amidohydrolase
MDAVWPVESDQSNSVRMTNREGRSPIVFTCDQAPNILPAEFGTLSLSTEELACYVGSDLSATPAVSRMADVPDLVPPVNETVNIPGNAALMPRGLAARRLGRFSTTPSRESSTNRWRAGRTWLGKVAGYRPSGSTGHLTVRGK